MFLSFLAIQIHGLRLQPPISGHSCPRSILEPWNEDKDVHCRVSSLEPAMGHSFSARVFSESWLDYSISSRVSRRAKTRTRNRRGFSRRAKTHTRNRRVLLSPRSTALVRNIWQIFCFKLLLDFLAVGSAYSLNNILKYLKITNLPIFYQFHINVGSTSEYL